MLHDRDTTCIVSAENLMEKKEKLEEVTISFKHAYLLLKQVWKQAFHDCMLWTDTEIHVEFLHLAKGRKATVHIYCYLMAQEESQH